MQGVESGAVQTWTGACFASGDSGIGRQHKEQRPADDKDTHAGDRLHRCSAGFYLRQPGRGTSILIVDRDETTSRSRRVGIVGPRLSPCCVCVQSEAVARAKETGARSAIVQSCNRIGKLGSELSVGEASGGRWGAKLLAMSGGAAGDGPGLEDGGRGIEDGGRRKWGSRGMDGGPVSVRINGDEATLYSVECRNEAEAAGRENARRKVKVRQGAKQSNNDSSAQFRPSCVLCFVHGPAAPVLARCPWRDALAR